MFVFIWLSLHKGICIFRVLCFVPSAQRTYHFVVKSHFDLPCVEITGVRLVLGKKRKGSTDFKAHKGASVEPLGSRLGLFYLSKVIDLKFFFRLDFEPVLQVCLYIKGKLGVGVCRVLVLWMLRQIVLLGVERADALHLDDAAAGGHDSQLIHAHQFFATKSSDKFNLSNFHKCKIIFLFIK